MWMSTHRVLQQVIEANLSLNYQGCRGGGGMGKAVTPSSIALHFVPPLCYLHESFSSGHIITWSKELTHLKINCYF